MSGLGDLFVNIRANATGLVSGLAHSQKKLRKFSRSAARTGRQMETLSRGMMGLGAAMAVPMIAGLREFAKFEKSMSNVATMLDAPKKHIGAFTSEVSRMSVEFGESTDALSGGLYDILSASIAPEKAMETLRVAVMAAKAGMTDTKTAADAITTVLNSYGLAASEATRVSDILFTIVKGGKTTFGELAPNIGKVAAIAATSGLKIEELATTIAVLTKNGLSTEETMTGIKGVINGFVKATPDAIKAAHDLADGLILSGKTLEDEGLLSVIRRLAELDADELVKIMPNIRAFGGMASASRDVRGFSDQLERMFKAAGATNTAFELATDNMQQGFDEAREALRSLGRTMGEVLAGDGGDFLSWFKIIALDLKAWVSANREMVRSVGTAIPKFAALAAGIWVISKAFKAAAAAAALFNMSMAPIVAAAAATAGGAAVGKSIAQATGLLETHDLSNLRQQSAGDPLSKESPRARIAKMQKHAKALEEEILHHTQRAESGLLRTFEATFGWTGLIETVQTTSIQAAVAELDELNKGIAEQARLLNAAQNEVFAAAAEEIKNEDKLRSDIVKHFGERVQGSILLVETLATVAGSAGEAVGSMWDVHLDNLRKAHGELKTEGQRLTELMRTPGEVFKSDMENIDRLLSQGFISDETWKRAAHGFRKALDESMDKPSPAQQQPGSIQTVTGQFKFNNLSTTAATLQQTKEQTKLQQQIANNTSRQNKQLAKLGPTP